MSPLTEKVDDATIDKQSVTPNSEDVFKSVINVLSDKLDHIVAAVGGPRPKARPQPKRAPSDFAKFGDKCLHCGSADHRARECPVKKKLISQNGGKLPSNYKSAFDKWREKQPKPVAPLMEDEDDEEFAETDLDAVWHISQCAITASSVCNVCNDTSFEHINSFAELFDDSCFDEGDDDSEVLLALQQLSSKITVGPKQSQRARKASTKQMDKRTIASVAKQVREGKLNLPDLQLESNDEYYAVWALVDSGAARSCARRRDHFPNTVTHLQPSTVKMATASGEELKSRGCFELGAFSAEGNRIVQTFEDADVDMPIMSVVELSSNGELGSDVVFRKSDGAILDVKSEIASKFVRRKGVYFMKLFVQRNRVDPAGFARPGRA